MKMMLASGATKAGGIVLGAAGITLFLTFICKFFR
jgi:hypothetical protein